MRTNKLSLKSFFHYFRVPHLSSFFSPKQINKAAFKLNFKERAVIFWNLLKMGHTLEHKFPESPIVFKFLQKKITLSSSLIIENGLRNVLHLFLNCE